MGRLPNFPLSRRLPRQAHRAPCMRQPSSDIGSAFLECMALHAAWLMGRFCLSHTHADHTHIPSVNLSAPADQSERHCTQQLWDVFGYRSQSCSPRIQCCLTAFRETFYQRVPPVAAVLSKFSGPSYAVPQSTWIAPPQHKVYQCNHRCRWTAQVTSMWGTCGTTWLIVLQTRVHASEVTTVFGIEVVTSEIECTFLKIVRYSTPLDILTSLSPSQRDTKIWSVDQ